MSADTPLFRWSDSCQTGSPQLDAEHERLVRLVNEAQGRLGSRTDVAAADRLLGELHQKLSLHFALEEKVLKGMEGVDADAHIAHHNELLNQLTGLVQRFQNKGDFDAAPEIEALLAGWLHEHFSRICPETIGGAGKGGSRRSSAQ